MRGGNLLSNLSVLARNAAFGGVPGAGGLRSAPRRGPPASQGLGEPRRDPPGLVCRPVRCDGAAPGLADHPHGLASARGIASECRVATAAREQHEGRGRHLGCTTLTRTADPARLLPLAPHRAGTGRAWLRRPPGLLRQPPVPQTTSSPAQQQAAAPGWRRRQCRRARGRCQPPGSLAKLGSSLAQVGPPAPESPCADGLRAAVDGWQRVAQASGPMEGGIKAP
jgi:hypothetical protein